MKSKRSDYILIGGLFIILILICVSLEFMKKKGNTAFVYYENKVVLTIPLNTDVRTYEVMGQNGIVKIIAGDGKIKVDDEKSPLHLCSRQGWIDSSTQAIVCLPNKIVIKIEDKEKLDGVVK